MTTNPNIVPDEFRLMDQILRQFQDNGFITFSMRFKVDDEIGTVKEAVNHTTNETLELDNVEKHVLYTLTKRNFTVRDEGIHCFFFSKDKPLILYAIWHSSYACWAAGEEDLYGRWYCFKKECATLHGLLMRVSRDQDGRISGEKPRVLS